MYYVYIIVSRINNQTYVGYTTNLKKRMITHNSGGSLHTAKYKPWELVMYLAFSSKSQALAFEKYLKTGSGKAFSAKRFLDPAKIPL